MKKGFTLIELMISVAIFAFMTAFLLAKYGKFDQSVLLTNLAYDVALTIRQAQSYGISVKDAQGFGQFDYPYGVYLTTGSQFILFADQDFISASVNGNGLYDNSTDANIKVFNIKKNIVIQSVCVGTGSLSPSPSPSPSPDCANQSSVSITFRRPDPNAIIKTSGCVSPTCPYAYAEIVLRSSDNSTKKVVIRSTGQIAVTN